MRSGPRWQSSLRRTRHSSTPPSSSALDGQSGRPNTQAQGTIGQVKAGAQDTRGIAVDSAVGPLKWRQCTRTDPVRRVLSALSAGDPPGCAPARHILVLVITVDKWITSSLKTPDLLVFLASDQQWERRVRRLNPHRRLRMLDWRTERWASVSVPLLHVEARSETRRHRRYCPARRHWKSLAHVPGGRRLTKLS
jgi:hypothetical protein